MRGVSRRLMMLLAVLLAFAMIAASCGDDDDEGGVSTTDSSDDGSSDDGGDDSSDDSADDSSDDSADDSSDDSSDDSADDSSDDSSDDSTDDSGDDGETMGPENADLDARLQYIGTSPPPQTDPALSVSRCDAPQLAMIYDLLVRNTPSGELVPGLALEWDAPDASTFVMTLREDVVFSDGTPFNADAVKASIERGQTLELSTISPVLEVIEEVNVIDDYTIEMKLNVPRAGIMPSVFNGLAGMIPSPTAVEALGDDYGVGTSGVGAGPFVLTDLVPDENASYDKNPTHWNADNIYLAGTDHLGQANEFQIERIKDGEVDFSTMKDSDLPLAEAAKADGDIDYIISPTVQYGEMFIKANVAPYDDPLVRQALQHAIDRPLIAEVVTTGGEPAYAPISPVYLPGSVTADDWPYEYDPEKSKELLAEAGYPDGLDITVAQINVPYYTNYAEAMQILLKDAGFNVELISIEGVEINKALYQRQELDAAFTATLGSSEPGLTLETRYGSEGATNPSGVSPDGFDELLEEAFGSADGAVRAEKYLEAQQLLIDESLVIPLYYNGGLSAFRPEVHGIGRGYTTCEIGNFLEPIWIEQS